MKSPTNIQRRFVQAIEDAVTDIVQRQITVTKAHHVTDHAQYSTADLSAYVNRFREAGHWELLNRLAEAFLKVNLAPVGIVRALEYKESIMTKRRDVLDPPYIDSEPLELDRSIPRDLPIPKPQIVIPEVVAPEQDEDPEIQTLTTVLKLLKRLPMTERRRVADQAYRYAGMGE